jgi:hypothetical protein
MDFAAMGRADFEEVLTLAGETWTRQRDTVTRVGNDQGGSGAPAKVADSGTPITLYVTWRKGEEPDNYRQDSAGAAYALPGTLLPGDRLTHPTHGSFTVKEEGPSNYLGVYERAEIRKARA